MIDISCLAYSQIKTVQAVLNGASGSVPAGAADRMREKLAAFGLDAVVTDAEPGHISDAVKAARAADPDLMIVLAGDGTASLAAQSCGPIGPLLICLPGGTMNMLPYSLHGRGDWEQVLERTLKFGRPQTISGGALNDRPFYVAAIIGAPAMWAKAREAVRKHDLKRAWMRAVHALKNAFGRSLRFSLADGPRRRAEALTLMCPLCSTAMDDKDQALEAAVLGMKNALDAARLGLNMAMGDWRRDPGVETFRVREGTVWARRRVTAILDGETTRFRTQVKIKFIPVAFRALVAPTDTAHPQP